MGAPGLPCPRPPLPPVPPRPPCMGAGPWGVGAVRADSSPRSRMLRPPHPELRELWLVRAPGPPRGMACLLGEFLNLGLPLPGWRKGLKMPSFPCHLEIKV